MDEGESLSAAEDVASLRKLQRTGLSRAAVAQHSRLHRSSQVRGTVQLKAIQLINTLTKELDIHAAMESVRHVALELLECERVTLFLVIESRQELRGNTGPADEGRSITVKFGEGIAGVVAQQGGLMNIPDAYSHPLFNPDIDRATHYHTRNILCTAIKDMSGRSIAVVQALNKLSGSFTKVDEQHIQLFGVHLGNTLAKSRFYEEAKREKERLGTLSKCFKRLNAVTSLGGALDTIAAAVKELVCAEHVVVLLMDHARQVLWTRITNKHTHGQGRLIRVQRGEGLLASCATEKRQLALCLAADQESDETLLKLHRVLAGHSSGLSDVLLQPVLDGTTENVMAVLCALNKADTSDGRDIFYEPTFTPSDCEAVNVFSMEVADVLSARAVEVSFASALSVVTSLNGSRPGSQDGGSGSNDSHHPPHSTPPDELSHMLKSHMLDYAPADMGSEERGASTTLGGAQVLQHSHTINVASLRVGSRELGGVLDGAVDRAFLDVHETNMLCRFSSLSAASRAASSVVGSSGSGVLGSSRLSSGPLSPSNRSFHHCLPEVTGASTAPSCARRTELATWDLDCTALSKEELVRVAYDVFMLSGVLEELDIPESELTGFLSAVSAHYPSPEEVPYHNLAHVVQVLHAVWLLLEATSARAVLSPEEELVLLIAAICHDLDHDGYTNSFHIYSQSQLAQQYNDKSVQENHHCALTFAVLSQRGANLFCRFTREEFFAARKLLIDAILGTDMHHHFALTQELLSHTTVFQAEEDADRTLLVKALLHAADISNHVRPFPVALSHAERVQQEFRRQVARERSLGLPVSLHMEAPEQTWAKMEVQFIDYVAGPLWERLAQIFPTLQEPLQHMRVNRAKFAAMAQSCLELASADSRGALPLTPAAPSSRSSTADDSPGVAEADAAQLTPATLAPAAAAVGGAVAEPAG